MNEIYEMLKPRLIRQATDRGRRRDGHTVGVTVTVTVTVNVVVAGNMQIICALCVQLPH